MRLSIIIPVLGELKRLEDTLVSVLENRPEGCQIVVVLNGPYEDPYDLKDEVCFVQAGAGAGFAESVNAGIAASQAEILHILTSGVEVTSGWADAAMACFADARAAAVAPLVLDRQRPERVVSAGLTYRVGGAVRRLGYGKRPEEIAVGAGGLCGADTLAAFYRKSALETVGGLDFSTTSTFAALDLALALKKAGLLCLVASESRTYADRDLITCSSSLREGLDAERIFWRWAAEHGWIRSLAGHAGLVAGECLCCLVRPANVCRLAGRVLGGVRVVSPRRQPRLAPSLPLAGPVPGQPHFQTADCQTPLESQSAR